MEKEIKGFLGKLQYINKFIARLTIAYELIFKLLRKNKPVVLIGIWKDKAVFEQLAYFVATNF